MDLCRADSRDLSLPEMDGLAEQLGRDPALSAEFARIQNGDRLLRSALREVPVPSGLAERMLASVSQSLSNAEVPTVGPAVSRLPSPARSYARRRSLVWGIASAAAILLVVFGSYYGMVRVGSVKQLEGEVAALLDAPPVGPAWSNDIAHFQDQFPYERWLRAQPKRWRSIRLAGDEGVVYDLVGVDDGGAFLFVVSTSKRYGLPSGPQIGADSGSGQRRQIAWQQPGLVYVLATDGRLNRPTHFLKQQKLAIAGPGPQVFARR